MHGEGRGAAAGRASAPCLWRQRAATAAAAGAQPLLPAHQPSQVPSPRYGRSHSLARRRSRHVICRNLSGAQITPHGLEYRRRGDAYQAALACPQNRHPLLLSTSVKCPAVLMSPQLTPPGPLNLLPPGLPTPQAAPRRLKCPQAAAPPRPAPPPVRAGWILASPPPLGVSGPSPRPFSSSPNCTTTSTPRLC